MCRPVGAFGVPQQYERSFRWKLAQFYNLCRVNSSIAFLYDGNYIKVEESEPPLNYRLPAVQVSCSQIVLWYAFLFHICVVKCNPYSVLAYTVFHGAALCYLGPLICLADVSDGRTLRSTAISHLAVWTGFVGDFINSPRNIRELSGGKFCHGKVAKIVNKK